MAQPEKGLNTEGLLIGLQGDKTPFFSPLASYEFIAFGLFQGHVVLLKNTAVV